MPTAQRNLFDDPDPAALVRSQPFARALTRNQRRFNQLTERLQKLRTELEAWQRAVDRYRQRAAAEVEPLQRDLLAAQRASVQLLDQLLESNAKVDRLTRARRSKLAELVVTLAGNVLKAGPDREIETVFDRYSELDYEEIRRTEMDFAESIFGDVFGEEFVARHGASSVDDLIDHASEQLHERREAEDAERRERARRAGGGTAGREAEASQSVRDLFRRLASALHPDREVDARERARKTLLMQRVNQAYESNDLLALLNVQCEIEQIAAGHLTQASEERLGHYCTVLREQEQALRAQLNAIQLPFASELITRPRGPIRPAELDLLIDREVRAFRDALQQVRDVQEAMRDPQRRGAAIDAIEFDDEGPDAVEAMMLAAVFGPPPAHPKKRRPSAARKPARSKASKSRSRGRA